MQKGVFKNTLSAIGFYKRMWLMILLFITPLVYAENEPNSSLCVQLKSAQDILDCALQFHPDLKQMNQETSYAEALPLASALRPNPEFNAKATTGNSLGDQIINAEIGFVHIFELGGKRDARIEKAQSILKMTRSERLSVYESIAINTVDILYRIKHIFSEREVLDQILEKLPQFISQLKTRPLLTPEQQVSLTLYEFSLEHAQIERRDLNVELEALEGAMEYTVGHPISFTESLLPSSRTSWPKFKEESEDLLVHGLIQKAQAEILSAQSDLLHEQAKAWPNLLLGPQFQSQRNGAIQQNTFGLVAGLSLPLYHMNGAAKAAAQLGVEKSELKFLNIRKKASTERDYHVVRYQSAVESLAVAGKRKQISEKYKKIDTFLRRGLVTGSLVLETFRQILDLTKNVNLQELKAIDSMWRIFAYDGKISENKL